MLESNNFEALIWAESRVKLINNKDKDFNLVSFFYFKKKIREAVKYFNAINKSQIVMKENPMKSPRQPPNSATRDVNG